MKHDAIVNQGHVSIRYHGQASLIHYPRIPIHERVELPESWIPADSRVEIDAKITAGMLISVMRLPVQSDDARLLHCWKAYDSGGVTGCSRSSLGGVSCQTRPEK